MTEDVGNHGAGEYTSEGVAFREGLATAHPTHAILRTGRLTEASSGFSRRLSLNVHTKYAWSPADTFLVALRFSHVPVGCGVWPAFWTVNSDVVWPNGGELDIIEQANLQSSPVTLHTSATDTCMLDKSAIDRCTPQSSSGARAGFPHIDCSTDYFHNKQGCNPKPMEWSTGEWHNKNPGIMAAEWTLEFVKVFFIPEAEIPADFDNPRPALWDKYIIAYMPFGNCPKARELMKPQEIVLNIALCGDLAGQAWDWPGSTCPFTTGEAPRLAGCETGQWSSAKDCCTRYIGSDAAEAPLRHDAFFNISWIKVFGPHGDQGVRHLSGTYRRKGKPMTA